MLRVAYTRRHNANPYHIALLFSILALNLRYTFTVENWYIGFFQEEQNPGNAKFLATLGSVDRDARGNNFEYNFPVSKKSRLPRGEKDKICPSELWASRRETITLNLAIENSVLVERTVTRSGTRKPGAISSQ